MSTGATNPKGIKEGQLGSIVLRMGRHRWHGLQCHASSKEGQVSPYSERSFDFLNIRISKSHLDSIFALLLLCGDVESNPGPASAPFLKVTSINCRGLTDQVKFLSTISKLKRDCKTNEHAIYCLQEVHLIDLSLLGVVWEGAAVSLSACARNSKGTLIIGKGDFTIAHEVVDANGRFNVVKLSYTQDLVQTLVIIANVYAPNDHKESLAFFKDFFVRFEAFLDAVDGDNIVLCGDFNCVFDPDSDSICRNSSNAEKELTSFLGTKLNQLELWDMVQISQSKNNYTWGRAKTKSRLDYIFASSNLAINASKFVNLWHLVKTDHAAVSVEFSKTNMTTSGRSYLKLSLNDIKDPDNLQEMKLCITNAIANSDSNWDPHTILEYVKMQIRSCAIYLKSKNKREFNSLETLTKEYNELMANGDLNEIDHEYLSELSIRIEKGQELLEEKLRLKAGIKWRE